MEQILAFGERTSCPPLEFKWSAVAPGFFTSREFPRDDQGLGVGDRDFEEFGDSGQQVAVGEADLENEGVVDLEEPDYSVSY